MSEILPDLLCHEINIYSLLEEYKAMCFRSSLQFCLLLNFSLKLLLLRTFYSLYLDYLIFSDKSHRSTRENVSHLPPIFKILPTLLKSLPQQPVESQTQHHAAFLWTSCMVNTPRNRFKYGLSLSCTPLYQEFSKQV